MTTSIIAMARRIRAGEDPPGGICPVCDGPITIKQLKRARNNKSQSGPFCSHLCARAYASAESCSLVAPRELPWPVSVDSLACNNVRRVTAHYTALFPERSISADLPQSARVIALQLQSFTTEQLMEAATGLSMSSFHTNKQLTEIPRLYRDAETIERFIGFARNPGGANATPNEISKRATEVMKEVEKEASRNDGKNLWDE